MKFVWLLKIKCETSKKCDAGGGWVWALSPEHQGESVSSDGEDFGGTVSAAALGYFASWTDRN